MGRALRTLGVLVALGALAASPTAQAAFPGENGRIAFVSGMGGPAGDDSGSDLYILSGPNGSVVTLDSRSGQHRHPSWSPDLKRVAYALWDGPNNEKVWVHVVASGSVARLGSHSSAVRDDRPSWSSDGTRIAYESEVVDGSGQMDIIVKDVRSSVTTGPMLNLTQTSGFIEGKPVWSPNGKWIYYSRRALASTDDDILRIRSDGTGIPQFIVNSATAEYQAALSPDGKRMCYTRGAFGSAAADVFVKDLDDFGAGYDLSDTDQGAYNCAWSPDGRYVAYVVGIYTNGALLYERSDDSGSPAPLTTDTAGHFDGNPDWAPKRAAFCQGKPLTIAGNDKANTINGTSERDVIHAFGGNDVVRGKGGNDLICGGDGNDRLLGGSGRDTLYGQAGNDRLSGETGNDTCVGGPGSDTVSSC